MKTNLWFVFGLLLSGPVFGQSTSSTPAAVSTPLSPGTLEKIQRLTSLFDGKTLEGWICQSNAWTVKDGTMASTGQGRGVIYTRTDYGSFRLIFNIRHVSGQPDHQACVLIFCARPAESEKPLDALGGIQFQPPNGGHWDYRPGHNNSDGTAFTKLTHPKFDAHEWSQVELLVNVKAGTARMAVAQPLGTKAIEVLEFMDPTAARKGPIAWQMHNRGLFDEYKNVRIEIHPKEDKLLTLE